MGCHAHGQVVPQIGNVRGHFCHLHIWRGAQACGGIEHRKLLLVDHQFAVQARERRPGLVSWVLQIRRHKGELGVEQRHVKTEGAWMYHPFGVGAKRNMVQIALNPHRGIAHVATAYGVFDVGAGIVPQHQRQIAHHPFGAHLLQRALQIHHAWKPRLRSSSVIERVPANAGMAFEVGVGKADVGHFQADFFALDRPPQLGLQGVKRKAGLFKNPGKFGVALVDVDFQLPPLGAQLKLKRGALQPRHAWHGVAAVWVDARVVRQPANVVRFAACDKRPGLVDVALPVHQQLIHLPMRLVRGQSLEHGLAQRQALGQLADDADIPLVALHLSAAGGAVNALVDGDFHVATGPADVVVGGKAQPGRGHGVAVVVVVVGVLHGQQGLHVFQRQRRQVFAQRHIHRVEFGVGREGAVESFGKLGPQLQVALALLQVHMAAQIDIAAQLRHVQLRHVGVGHAGPVAPVGAALKKTVPPLKHRVDRLAPARRRRHLHLQGMLACAVVQTGLHIRQQQRRCVALRIAPADAAAGDLEHRLRQQPVDGGLGGCVIGRGIAVLLKQQAGNLHPAIGQPLRLKVRRDHRQAGKTTPRQRLQRNHGLNALNLQSGVACGVVKLHVAQFNLGLPAAPCQGNFTDAYRKPQYMGRVCFQVRAKFIDSRQNPHMQHQCCHPGQHQHRCRRQAHPARHPAQPRGESGTENA